MKYFKKNLRMKISLYRYFLDWSELKISKLASSSYSVTLSCIYLGEDSNFRSRIKMI